MMGKCSFLFVAAVMAILSPFCSNILVSGFMVQRQIREASSFNAFQVRKINCCGRVEGVHAYFEFVSDCANTVLDKPPAERSWCTFQCLGEDFKMVDDEGYVTKKGILKACEEMCRGDEVLVKLAKELVLELYDQIIEGARASSAPNKCNKSMGLMMGHFQNFLELRCPRKKQNPDLSCKDLRQQLKNYYYSEP